MVAMAFLGNYQKSAEIGAGVPVKAVESDGVTLSGVPVESGSVRVIVARAVAQEP